MAEPRACDLLIEGPLVLTLDADDSTFADGAVAIRAGEIVEVGPRATLAPRYRAKETIAAADAILLPGFVNAHNHTPLKVVRGMIEDRAFAPSYSSAMPAVHALAFEETLALARLGAYELLKSGVTTSVDYYRHPRALAEAAAELGLRAVIGGRIHDADTEALAEGRYEHRTEVGEATLRESADLIDAWDGRADGRIRCDLAPHAADTCTPALLREVASLAGRRGGNVHTHLAQSRREIEYVQERDGRSPVETLAEAGLLDPRLVCAHCVFLGPEEVARVGRAKIIVAHAPHQNAQSGNLAPILDLEAAGATITLCGDTRSPDHFETMRLALLSARLRGGGLEPKARRVLHWTTASPAAALGLSAEIGSLAPGRRADLILLDGRLPNLAPVIDGYGIVVHSANAANVDTVIVDGRVLIRGGRPVAFDGDAILREGEAVARALWASRGVPSIARA